MLLHMHSGVIMCKTATATVTDRQSGRLLTDERGTFRHHYAAECCPLPESCIVNLQAFLQPREPTVLYPADLKDRNLRLCLYMREQAP
jgi:hypothetical protein